MFEQKTKKKSFLLREKKKHIIPFYNITTFVLLCSRAKTRTHTHTKKKKLLIGYCSPFDCIALRAVVVVVFEEGCFFSRASEREREREHLFFCGF
jgi:hypothetical protein